jgi:HlyD family secretion protein
MAKTTILRKVKHWSKYALLIAIIALVAYWVRFSPVSVTGHEVKQGEITAEVMGTGTLESRVQMTVSSKIAGRITALPVDQGDSVIEGQVLVRLDDNELKQQVEIARSALAAADASLDRAEAEAVSTQAVLNQEKVDHRRIQQLYASRSISSTEMERSAQSLKVAEANHNKAKAAVMEARKKLIQARNTLDYHQARLGDTVIEAPVSGLIIRRDREPGDIVVPGTPIFLLISTTDLWVSAWVDETQMSKLAPGQKARIVFRSEPHTRYQGNVARLGRETDRETRQFIVDVTPDRLPENWAVGQRAEVFIQTEHKTDVVILPSNAILVRNGEKGVLLEDSGRAVWQPVEIGIRGKEKVEIVEGLEPGETVITGVVSKNIPNGKKVKVTNEPGR